ncbi:MAG: hypothetical protein IH991_02025 [Planctomycetes bacterium]|nr:hypothetical protein [Planctomycetota bacterium]
MLHGEFARSAHRGGEPPTVRNDLLAFRVTMTADVANVKTSQTPLIDPDR